MAQILMNLPGSPHSPSPVAEGLRMGALGLAALFAFGAPAQAQTAANPRWTHASSPAEPWVPGTVSLAGRDQFVWGHTGGANPKRMLLSSAGNGAIQANRSLEDYPTGSRPFASASGTRPDRVFGIDQDNPGVSSGARFWMRAYDPWAGASGVSMVPAWSQGMTGLPVGTCLLSTDQTGDSVVAAALVQGGVELLACDGTSGAVNLHLWMSGITLDALAVSADGSTIAVATGLTLRVFDSLGLIEHTETLTSSVGSLDLSGDGSTMAVGQLGGTRVLQRGAQGYGMHRFLLADANVPTQALSAKVDLSYDGRTLAVAHWRYASGPRTTLEFWDLEANVLLWQRVQIQAPSGLQILPTGARVSLDGRRAAFATWGDGSQPEVYWVDREDLAGWRAYDLPGSALALDMDARGERLVVAHKDTHAQVFASTGAVVLLDVTPATLALEAPVSANSSLELSAYAPGSSGALFLLGPKDSPSTVAGVTGSLLLKRSRLAVVASPVDPLGHATMQWSVPPSWLGPDLPFAIQVAFRTPNGTVLGSELLEPLLLP